MLRCYITDRRSLGGSEALLLNIERQIAAGVDWIQLREKDLEGRELLELARRVMALAAPHRTRVWINSRMDVVLACGAHGVHLPSRSPAPSEYKRAAPGLSVGVSCHDLAELQQAERQGADYAVLGPVFAPLSKSVAEPPLGLARFGELAGSVRIPVFALGGITEENIADCERERACGVAGISLFQAG